MEVHTRESLQEKDRSRKQGSSAGAGLLAVLGGLMFLAGFAVLFTGGILAGIVWMFLGGLLIRAAARAGLVSRHAAVRLPGGELEVRWAEENGHLYITGPAVTVFEGEISL